MEEHGSADEVARERKLLQAEQDAAMVDEAQDSAGVVVEELDGKLQAGPSGGKCKCKWAGLAGGPMEHILVQKWAGLAGVPICTMRHILVKNGHFLYDAGSMVSGALLSRFSKEPPSSPMFSLRG